MGNLIFFVVILLSVLTIEKYNKLGVWNPVVCSCISGSGHVKNLCYSQQNNSLSSMMRKLEREFCDTENMLRQSPKCSSLVIILNCLKQYCLCPCVITYMHKLKLKKHIRDSTDTEDDTHLVQAQRLCTKTWYFKSDSLISDGYTYGIQERHESHSYSGGRKKHRTVPNYICKIVSEPFYKIQKIIFVSILVIVECIILLSYAKRGLKFYFYDFSSSSDKLIESGKYDAVNPQMKVLSLTDADQTDIKAEAITSFVFRFRKFDNKQLFVYPASLEHYFKEVFHSKQSPSNLYRYEWARYKSFKHYPDSAVVLPLLLAKDGFYYTGYEDEVTCHFCDFTYRNWKRGDNVHNIHKKLSRHCKFVSGGETDNVSITGFNGQFHNNTVEGACGGPNDTNTMTENLNKLNLNESTDAESLQYTDKGEKSTGKKDILATNNDNNKRNVTDTDSVSPKHPAYAVDAVRLSSYSKWPVVVVPSPTVLCDAGFFYAGKYRKRIINICIM